MSKLSPEEVKREKAAEPEPRPHVPWVPALFLPSCHARGTGGRSGPCPFWGQNPASGSCVVSARILLARGPKSLGSRSAHRVPLSTRPLRRLPAAILLPSPPRSWCVRGGLSDQQGEEPVSAFLTKRMIESAFGILYDKCRFSEARFPFFLINIEDVEQFTQVHSIFFFLLREVFFNIRFFFFFFLNQLGPRTALRHRFCEKQMG